MPVIYLRKRRGYTRSYDVRLTSVLSRRGVAASSMASTSSSRLSSILPSTPQAKSAKPSYWRKVCFSCWLDWFLPLSIYLFIESHSLSLPSSLSLSPSLIAIEHIIQQHNERDRRERKIIQMREELRQLNEAIVLCQQQLPASGAPVTRQVNAVS